VWVLQKILQVMQQCQSQGSQYLQLLLCIECKVCCTGVWSGGVLAAMLEALAPIACNSKWGPTLTVLELMFE